MHSYLESFAGAFDGGGFSSQSLCTFTKCLSCFFSSSLLYSFLQAGRFTTKRQRESPINLVANHALDSSVDLCLCPSVCIFSFLFPPSLISIFSLFNLPLSSINHCFIYMWYSGSSISPSSQASPNTHHPFSIPTTRPLPQWPQMFYMIFFFFSDHQRISITCTHWRLYSKLIWTVSVESN